ncbi:peptide chain release factor N(5)-glutamine methyltransferase [Schaalia sp. lx-260]|uniref:peptide chain release factor N(5)-glutamine methyltransferase n=1 Tax=Schaalia sp. lx-260 TaxID=2899082 RepID=UPI001E2A2B6D|nr:peptide chain release factor N(5)-glutamine methyltransferase [Schaalia sp. lx-260]MCD4549653.1 peptide chain release factor N(5)-glutamine methyltransferase [Schaalia sp. lx-260]
MRELMQWARQQLTSIEGAQPAREASILMEWALGTDNLWTAPQILSPHTAERFRSGVHQRRARIPLQHIIGRMWFRNLELYARPGVFICRPETEVVAGAAIDEAHRYSSAEHEIRVVDLCTGSGAIALALATEVEHAHVYAVELMPTPYDTAARNIHKYCLEHRIHLHQGDATDPQVLREIDGTVDVLISNPPYIPEREPVTQKEALYDPSTALYGGGEDGMVLPRGIIHRAWNLLKSGGALFVEHATSQAQDMRESARSCGFIDVHTGVDLTGRDRYLCARKP